MLGFKFSTHGVSTMLVGGLQAPYVQQIDCTCQKQMTYSFSSCAGRSVRILRRANAEAHLWGGNAFVKISAVWSFVLMYSGSTLFCEITSLRLLKLTLCVREICLSFGEKPLRTRSMVASLSSLCGRHVPKAADFGG